jgi:hypothetical protein
VSALERKDFMRAKELLLEQFSRANEQPDAFLDSGYIAGVLAVYANAAEAGLDFLRHCAAEDRFSPKFSFYFGRALAAFGDAGEQIRKELQRLRLIPWHVVGFLGIQKDFTQVEPWYFSRSMTNLFPRRQEEFRDVERVVEHYVLPGWTPSAPPFSSESKLLTLGSCFAQELRNYLAEKGMSADWLFVPPGLNNTFALRNFISWCLTGETSTKAYWYDEGAKGGAVKWDDDSNRASYAAVFEKVDGIILTVGLAEVWLDSVSGGVFWRGVPKSLYDETRHVCRVSSVEENEDNLREIVRLIRAVKPDIPIILTLSPVPLRATASDKSCITVDTVSKAILRVAIDNVMASKPANVYYWPSFEIVRSLAPHLPHEWFGEDGNTRHVNRDAVHMILKAFMRHFFGMDSSKAESRGAAS